MLLNIKETCNFETLRTKLHMPSIHSQNH